MIISDIAATRGVFGGHVPTLIELFRNTKCIGRVGITSSIPAQFLESSCAYEFSDSES